MLNKVDFPLTNSQISEFILDEGYTTYFKLQQAISELIGSGFMKNPPTAVPSTTSRKKGHRRYISSKMISLLLFRKISILS